MKNNTKPMPKRSVHARLRVLQLLATGKELTGAAIMARKEVPRGSVYTTLHRLEHAGLVRSRIDANPRQRGSPSRLYVITSLGARVLELQTELTKLLSR